MSNNKKNGLPKHVELREKLRSKFQRMAPNSPIPSARELALTHKVSAMTIRQALVALQQEGIIHSVPGLGTFISDHRMSKRLVFTSFSQEVIERGMKPSSKVVSATKSKLTDKKISELLQLQVGDPIYRIERIMRYLKIPLKKR